MGECKQKITRDRGAPRPDRGPELDVRCGPRFGAPTPAEPSASPEEPNRGRSGA